MSRAIVYQDAWHACYTGNWVGLITPEAMAHPAKFSRSLIQRIYQHAREEGWVRAGDVVLDPFGGVSLGALDALLMGCTHISCELEPRFHQLALENVALWQRKYGHLPGYGVAVCLQGDSRALGAVLAEASCVVSSPPYADRCSNDNQRTLAREGLQSGHNEGDGGTYGNSPGNLSTLPTGQPGMLIASPPYTGNEKSDYLLSTDGKTRRRDEHRGYRQGHGCFRGSETYGQSTGQLGAMPAGNVQAVVSSPPYCDQSMGDTRPLGGITSQAWPDRTKAKAYLGGENYGETSGQLGTTHGETFWAAARTILEQCTALLPAGGHAIFVVKQYVQGGKIIDFPGQWAALCQAVGLTWLHHHHALLTQEHGTELGLFGGETARQTKRVSFFRRLHEAKRPDLAIEWEDILCFRRE